MKTGRWWLYKWYWLTYGILGFLVLFSGVASGNVVAVSVAFLKLRISSIFWWSDSRIFPEKACSSIVRALKGMMNKNWITRVGVGKRAYYSLTARGDAAPKRLERSR